MATLSAVDLTARSGLGFPSQAVAAKLLPLLLSFDAARLEGAKVMTRQPLTLCSVMATFLLVVTSPAMAQTSDQTRSSAAGAEQKVRDLEEERLRLFYESDVALLDRLFADDLVMVTHHPPRMRNKKQFVEDFKSDKSKVSHVSQDIKQVRVYGDTAIVNGTMSIKKKDADGRDSTFGTLYTHVWIKRDGQWKLASVHRSPTELQGKPVSGSRR